MASILAKKWFSQSHHMLVCQWKWFFDFNYIFFSWCCHGEVALGRICSFSPYSFLFNIFLCFYFFFMKYQLISRKILLTYPKMPGNGQYMHFQLQPNELNVNLYLRIMNQWKKPTVPTVLPLFNDDKRFKCLGM